MRRYLVVGGLAVALVLLMSAPVLAKEGNPVPQGQDRQTIAFKATGGFGVEQPADEGENEFVYHEVSFNVIVKADGSTKGMVNMRRADGSYLMGRVDYAHAYDDGTIVMVGTVSRADPVWNWTYFWLTVRDVGEGNGPVDEAALYGTNTTLPPPVWYHPDPLIYQPLFPVLQGNIQVH
jgi:hypothetical protein